MWGARPPVRPILGMIGLTLGLTACLAPRLDPLDVRGAGDPSEVKEQEIWEAARQHQVELELSEYTLEDAELGDYLTRIAARLIDPQQPTPGSVQLTIVRDPLPNAWVYPHGSIVVHAGLLASMKSEDELAAVLSHEIAHHVNRDTYRQAIQNRRQAIAGMAAGVLLTAAVAAGTGVVPTDMIQTTGAIWALVASRGYSRKLELEADRAGLTRLVAAGYDPRSSIDVFQRLSRDEEFGEPPDASRVWSTHPSLDERIESLEEILRTDDLQGEPGEGLLVGDAFVRMLGPALLESADLEAKLGLGERARETLARYREVRPEVARAPFLIGESFRLEDPATHMEERLAAYALSRDLDPTSAPTHREIGMTHRCQGRSLEAVDAFIRYLRLAPDAADAGIIQMYCRELTDDLGVTAPPGVEICFGPLGAAEAPLPARPVDPLFEARPMDEEAPYGVEPEAIEP